MGFNLDFTSDFYLQDNLAPVTLQVAGLADVQIPAAASMPAKYAELDPSGGNVLEGDKLFAWPQNASPQPPLGAKIVDGNGDAWTILAVDAKGDVKTWDCHSRALAIVNRLDNTAAVLQATYTKSPGGEAIPTWTQVLSGIPARFQPVEQRRRSWKTPNGRRPPITSTWAWTSSPRRSPSSRPARITASSIWPAATTAS